MNIRCPLVSDGSGVNAEWLWSLLRAQLAVVYSSLECKPPLQYMAAGRIQSLAAVTLRCWSSAYQQPRPSQYHHTCLSSRLW